MGKRLTENINKLRDVSPRFFLPSDYAPLLVDHIEPHVYMDSWSVQPFNGQVQRMAAVMALGRALRPTVALETGTYLGSTTPYLAGLAERGAVTIEIDDFNADRAQRRFTKNHARVPIRLLRGDSARMTAQALGELDAAHDRVLAYLDAHWLDQIPTASELEALHAWGGTWAAVIDDFEVPGDDGYVHDRYGDVVIGPSIVPALPDLEVWVIAAPSSQETGARCGTGFVFPATVAAALPASVMDQLRRVR